MNGSAFRLGTFATPNGDPFAAIVLGKLLGSLLQIVLFLAGMVPVLALLMLLGGVSAEQVLQAAVVLAAAAFAAGSLGGLVATMPAAACPVPAGAPLSALRSS